MTKKFLKYDTDGAYHWRTTYSGGWRRSSPSAHARYDVALDLIAERHSLDGSIGLDVGCGDGVMLYKISRRGARGFGVDMEMAGLVLANEHLARFTGRSTSVVCASAYALPFHDNSVDFVVSTEVIEHLDGVHEWLAEIARVLKPGGCFALTTPNRSESGELRDEYHVREFDAQELGELLSVHFGAVRIIGQYPRWLDRAYSGSRGVRSVDLLARAVVKVATKLGFNPFRAFVTAHPDFSWNGLAGSAVKTI